MDLGALATVRSLPFKSLEKILWDCSTKCFPWPVARACSPAQHATALSAILDYVNSPQRPSFRRRLPTKHAERFHGDPILVEKFARKHFARWQAVTVEGKGWPRLTVSVPSAPLR
jgi:hypothetical protein